MYIYWGGDCGLIHTRNWLLFTNNTWVSYFFWLFILFYLFLLIGLYCTLPNWTFTQGWSLLTVCTGWRRRRRAYGNAANAIYHPAYHKLWHDLGIAVDGLPQGTPWQSSQHNIMSPWASSIARRRTVIEGHMPREELLVQRCFAGVCRRDSSEWVIRPQMISWTRDNISKI